MLFSAALGEHARRTQNRAATREAAAAAAAAAAPALAAALVDRANAHVSQIYDLQLQIEAESRAVRAELASLERNVTAVGTAVRQLTDSLKLLGDFENYVNVLEARVDKAVAALGAAPAAGAAQPSGE